jgi:hypothetical protein
LFGGDATGVVLEPGDGASPADWERYALGSDESVEELATAPLVIITMTPVGLVEMIEDRRAE